MGFRNTSRKCGSRLYRPGRRVRASITFIGCPPIPASRHQSRANCSALAILFFLADWKLFTSLDTTDSAMGACIFFIGPFRKTGPTLGKNKRRSIAERLSLVIHFDLDFRPSESQEVP